jgi:hypothetical protein
MGHGRLAESPAFLRRSSWAISLVPGTTSNQLYLKLKTWVQAMRHTLRGAATSD